MNNLSRTDLANLIKGSLEIDYTKLTTSTSHSRQVIGSILHNTSSIEKEITNLACARRGDAHVEFGLESGKILSTSDILSRISLVSSAVDLLVTSFCDSDTFGAGRQLTEQIADYVKAPAISLMDDIYAPQPALGVLATLWSKLGDLSGKDITISWGYGSRFTSPRIAHSLLKLGITLGAKITVLAPPEFPLLRRVFKEAENTAAESNGHFQEVGEFKINYLSADAVIGLNWCRLDDYKHPEKNKTAAMEHKEWYFTEDALGSHSFFISEPPVQSDLLASDSLIHSPRNLTSLWLDMRTRALLQSFNYVRELQSEGKTPVLV